MLNSSLMWKKVSLNNLVADIGDCSEISFVFTSHATGMYKFNKIVMKCDIRSIFSVEYGTTVINISYLIQGNTLTILGHENATDIEVYCR